MQTDDWQKSARCVLKPYLCSPRLTDFKPARIFFSSGNDHPLDEVMCYNVSLFSKLKFEGLSKDTAFDITTSTEGFCNQQKFLVFECGPSDTCGGLGDRQRGLASAFLLALLTNRRFVIEMDSPCPLENFLEPNTYDWTMCKSFLEKYKRISYKQLDYIDTSKAIVNVLRNSDIVSEWQETVIGIHINDNVIEHIRRHNYTRSRLNWLLDTSNVEAFRLVLNTLFKPKKLIVQDLKHIHMEKVRDKHLVCAHIRIGRNPSNPIDAKLDSAVENDSDIFSFFKMYSDRKYVIYIASDSDDLKKKAVNSLENVISIDFTLVHVDKVKKIDVVEACNGFYMALLEQYLLSTCDTLLLTRSNFGRNAAYLRGSSDNLFLYVKQQNRIVRSNLSNIQEVFKYKKT